MGAARKPGRQAAWRRASRVAVVATAGSLGFASIGFGQVVPDAGTTLRQLQPPAITLPKPAPPALEMPRPARPALQPAPALRFRLSAFRITGVSVFPEEDLQAVVGDRIGQEVGIEELGEAVARLTRYYAERGFPLATAYLPVQDIVGGVVELVVLEGRYGDVRVDNRSAVADAVILAHLAALPASVVDGAALERKLLLLRDLRGAVLDRAVLSPGQAVGDTDLRVELAPGRRAAGTVELDNYGSRYSGANRLSGQVDWFSPTGGGDLLSARAIKGDPDLSYARLAYEAPLGGNGLKLGAAYSDLAYRLGGSFRPLEATGEAQSGQFFLSYALLRSRLRNLYARIGYDHKNLEDRIGVTGTVSQRRSGIASLALSGDSADFIGAGGVSAYSIGYSAGELRIDTPAAKAIDDASARTNGSFNRWNVNFVHLRSLTERTALWLSFQGQKAGKNLDSSEKIVLGGINGVRAYPQGEAPGDSGYILSAELRYTLTVATVPGAWQVAGLVDVGEVRSNENPFVAGPNRRQLSGAGVALDWTHADRFSVRLAVAHRLGDERAFAGSDSPTRGWIQAIKYF